MREVNLRPKQTDEKTDYRIQIQMPHNKQDVKPSERAWKLPKEKYKLNWTMDGVTIEQAVPRKSE